MGKAPDTCPMCGKWFQRVDTTTKGFSVGKSVLGWALLGPIGLLGGGLGRKKSTYFCKSCGFSHEYDG